MSVANLALKFRGCLVGSHIGDCLGYPFEGELVSKSVLSQYFEKILIDTRGGAQFQPYTDDTAMTFSIAESLIEKSCFDPIDIAKRFVNEYFNYPRRGYGENVVDVFRTLKQIDFSDVFEPAKLQFRGTGSYGNGAAMRTAPIALYCYHHDEETLKKLAKECALITHAHQNGYNGAILQCLAIDLALKTDSSSTIDPVQFANSLLEKMEILEEPLENIKSFEKEKPFCASLKIIKDLFEKEKNLSPTAIANLLGNRVVAHKSVPTAIYSFLRGMQPLEDFQNDNPFTRAIYFAISVGGDTDTIAAMTGSIAGAFYSESKIQDCLFRKCETIDRSIDLSNKLFNLVSNK